MNDGGSSAENGLRFEGRLAYVQAAYLHIVNGKTASEIALRSPRVYQGDLSRISRIITSKPELIADLRATNGEALALREWTLRHGESIARRREAESNGDPELIERVLAFVLRARSVTATEIARSLDISRSEVNSALYGGVGRQFRRSEDEPPKWSVLDDKRSSAAANQITVPPITARHDFHVDFAGGDWKLRIVVAAASRNDPIARIENLGERHRLVTVAAYVSGGSSESDIPPAAVGIASSVLAWEIHLSLRAQGIDVFNFEEAVRDIFLSLTWQAEKLQRGS